MTTQISENLITLMDKVSSIKLYQAEEDSLYYAEVQLLNGTCQDFRNITMEALLYEVLDVVKRRL